LDLATGQIEYYLSKIAKEVNPHMPNKLKKTCGDCEFWMKDECDYLNHAKEGIITKSDPACEKFKEAKQPGKKQRKIYKDSGLAHEGYFEVIEHNSLPVFLVAKSKGLSLHETVSCNDKVFHPREAKSIPYPHYGLYHGELPSQEELFRKIRNEFHFFLDVEPIWKEVLSTCVLLSYQQEKLLTVPYIYVYGDNESGKSTVLQLLKFLCYRPMYGVTVPAADIYGYLNDFDSIGCILEDEVQGIHKDIDKIKIYKAGYKQGAVVPRTILLQHDRVIKYYNTFCFKACASEQIPQVKGFRERFIEISMIEGYPQLEWTDITQNDLKRLHDLRDMLLKWRLLSREWQLPNPELSIRGRLKELWKPLLQITRGLSVHETLFNFVDEQKNERLSSKQNTLEGHIVKVVSELHNQAKEPVLYLPFQIIWQELTYDLEGKIDDKKPHVMDTSEFFQVTKNKVGYRLREILSGKSIVHREKDSDDNWISIKAYVFDHEKLRRVARKYGYELVTKLPSLLSSQSITTSKTTLKTHENNVEKHLDTPSELGKLSNLVTRDFLNQVHSYSWLLSSSEGKCGICKKKGTLTHSVQLIPNRLEPKEPQKILCCRECGETIELQKRGQEE